MADPLFGMDVGFYVFQLPFYQLLQTAIMLLTVITTLAVGGLYTSFQSLQIQRGGSAALASTPVSRH